jgi:ELP3 family radical SAM enzyme/protein acetyltransferase
MSDIEDICASVAQPDAQADAQADPVLKSMLEDMLALPADAYEPCSPSLHKTFLQLARKYKRMPSKGELGTLYRALLKESSSAIPYNETLYRALILKSVRSTSGILNVSVSLPPDKFSCKYNCYFCPNEPGMPRSYLSNEDVFKRASVVGFNTVAQVYDRLDVLERNGHPIDKVEFRVLGGTFSCYDHAITDVFVRDLYYTANTYYGGRGRVAASLEEEQEWNVGARVHVVGLGVETRPDEITLQEVVRFRRYGITRVELGVQHTDDELLRRVNRGHGIAESKAAIRLLKNYGFKLEIHIMADLPGATPEGDMACYTAVLRDDPDLIPDYMKDYPCLDVSYTKVRKWKEQGKWKPYAERTADARDLMEVLIYRQSITPPWVRVNRVQRDFKPECAVELGYRSDSIKSNLAQLVKDAAEARGIYCQCIRCCEVRNEKYAADEITYNTYNFEASGAREYFIAAQVARPHRPLILGFIRLRLNELLADSPFPALQGLTAVIRELHVYGALQIVGLGKSEGQGQPQAQHNGIGRQLLSMAEAVAQREGYTRCAVISGVGVRGYYQKHGYVYADTYMVKELPPLQKSPWILIVSILVFLVACVVGQMY